MVSAVWLLWAWSCTERIHIELDDTYTRLVVDGSITNESMHHMIRLTTTMDYFSNKEPPGVRNAVIHLRYNGKSLKLSEFSGRAGFYALPTLFKAEPGTVYTLDIRLPSSIGGSSVYAAKAHMPDTDFRLDSIQMEYNSRYDFWLVKVFAQDPPTRDFYKFETFLNSISGNDTTMRVTSTPDKFFNGRNTNGFAVAFFDGTLLSAGDTLTLAMSAITEDYFHFYSEVRSESGFKSPLFAGPPANIRSNIKEGGLGYFSARKVERARIIVPDWRNKD